ncbi:protein ENHANCED DISEASE RESISTANCE 4-like isoform X2 [Abrus precatorius]|uniref:Protein ENHANCED DISEASE RESISTANCE 4-like isoform X2 n=1 Tax=Abrus precatorius TaxID=3816 RepID=A0A8B8JWD8_ABRPR|nr:protein ENHANCED DISEASE RESISTANCE 4-like isoform X2 [Abrus precatorius]
MEDTAKLRLVRCPKCQNVLPELANYSVYQCGGCNAVLRAKLKGSESGSMWEASDEGQGGGDDAKSGNSLGKGVVDLSDNSDVDVKSNGGFSGEDQRRDSERSSRGHEQYLDHSKDGDEKGVLENGFDVNKDKDEGGKSKGRVKQEQKYRMGGSEFSGRMSNWPNEERGGMEGFWRKPQAEIEGVRFTTLNYPDEGTSNSYSSFSYNHGEQWRNYKDMDGVNRVQHLEQDRAELLRKLDELSNQLNKSSEVVHNQKEKVVPHGKMVPPDPYSGPTDTFFPDGSSGMNRTSRQFFGPNKHMAGPSYFNYHHDPYAYTSGHEMAMPNFHPSMHNPNYMPGYADPFASQMMRGSHPLPHQFLNQPMHPYFPERYADTAPNSYDPYAYSAMLHAPSCSCLRCYENRRRGSVPVPPAAFVNGRFPHAPNDPMLYHHEMPGSVGPHAHNSRTAIPAVSLHEKQLHTRWPEDYNSEISGFVRSRPRKVMPAGGIRHCHPIAGGSPFITCQNCFELLQLPKKALVMVRKRQQKMRCGACSSEINFAVINKKLVFSLQSEMRETTTSTRIDDTINDVGNNRVLHSHGHVNTSAVNFSSDDYSGYDFQSVDRESPVLAVDPSLNSSKSHEMQSFRSSSSSTSEDENSPEVMTAPSETTKSIDQPTNASLYPPPTGSPLQEYFDYSSNNHVVNRHGKGNQSSRSDQEKAKIEKNTSRQNSLKEVVLATEMDVHDYSNTVVSQDSGDASREHDHPRSNNKGGESFLANIIKKGFRDFSLTNQIDDHSKSDVTVNGQPIPDRVIKKAEKLAGPIQPGNYWYDFRAGFWGVMGGPCLGIILPFIEEFSYPMPDKCAGGNTAVFVNGRELHQKDLDLLSRRGLPHDSNRSYIIEISGRVLDEDTGEELDSLGKLAPTTCS